jgi:formylglycine-generating enzyme required for sulfatase activity
MRARRTRVVLGVLLLMLVGAGIGWKQDYLKAQYYWRVVMRPSVLSPEKERALAAKGGEFSECGHGCPTMVVVPAGRFTMGSPESEKYRDANEGPQHTVTIGKPFAVGKYDVTFAEWDTCVDAGACPRASDSGFGRGDRPVIYVNWDEAKDYVAWLSGVTGKHYRLLSEAEWEYAARAGSNSRYYFGDNDSELDQYAWYAGNSSDQTHPVGQKRANAFGLYGMHGNVWQRVEDVYHRSYEGAPNDGRAWIEGGGDRVLRGGAWLNIPNLLRAAHRFPNTSGDRANSMGFRVARTLTP